MKSKDRNKLCHCGSGLKTKKCYQTDRHPSKKIPFNKKSDNMIRTNQNNIEEVKKMFPNDTIVGVCTLFHRTNEIEPNGSIPKVIETGSVKGFSTEPMLDELNGKVKGESGNVVGMIDTLYNKDKGYFNTEEMNLLLVSYLSKTISYQSGKTLYGQNGDWGVIMNFYKYKRGIESKDIQILRMDMWSDITNDIQTELLKDSTSYTNRFYEVRR